MANGEVGDLKVKLSLDNAQFERSVTSMNRTLQAMGQEIRGLQNKGKSWGSSLDGLKTKQEAYGRLLEGQRTKVQKLAEQYEKAKSEQGEYSNEAQRLATQLNKANAEMTRTERELSEITAELERQQAELKKSQSSWSKVSEGMKAASDKMKTVGTAFKDVGRDLSMKVTAPLTALGIGAAKAAIDFESAFAGVRKTVNTSEEGFAKLEKGILEMARTLPASASEIAAVAESAGQLGIAEENILDFTKTIINLGEATNLTAEQGASEFARFANIVGMSQQDFDRLGSSIVGLGNTMATTESEIMSMAMRLAAQGAQIGMTEAQILALSATMSSLGIEAEAGGTAMTTVLKKMQNAVSGGGKELDIFARTARMSTTEFAEAFKTDAASALDLFVKGLALSGGEGQNLNDILDDLKIKGIREADTLLRMAGASDLLSAAINTSTTAWGENTALSDEAAQRYATTASQLAMLKNKVVEAGIALGSVLLPFIIQIVDFLGPLITKFAEMDSSIQTIILVIGGIAAAIGPVLVVIGALITSIGAIAGVIGTLSGAVASAGGFMAFLSSILAKLGAAFSVLTGPIGLTIAAIVGIVAAVTVAYNKVDWFREGVNTIFNKIKNVISIAMNSVKTFITDIWTQIKKFWSKNGDEIRQATQNVFNVIKSIVSVVMPVIQAVISVAMTAIKFIVEGVWNAVKGVIQGALNVILGIVKVFSSLFTGNWKGLWEGVKQLLMGVVEFIWNLMQLMFYGRIIKGLLSFAKLFTSAFSSLWTGIKTLFTSSINFVKNAFTTGFNAMKNTASSLMGGIRTVITTIWNSIKSIFTTVINAIKTVISTGFNAYLTLIKNTLNRIVTTITGMGSKMVQAGKDLISGLIKGMREMATGAIEAITGVVDGVIGKAKKMLKIASPSKLFTQYGRWVSQGLAIGIADDAATVQKAVENMLNNSLKAVADINKTVVNTILAANKENAKEITKIQSDAEKQQVKLKEEAQKKIKDLLAKQSDKEKEIHKSQTKKIAEIEKNAADKIQNIRNKAATQKKGITISQLQQIANIEKTAANNIVKLKEKNDETIKKNAKKTAESITKIEKDLRTNTTKIKQQTAKDIQKVEDTIRADRLKALKQEAEKLKQNGELTTELEVAYWKRALKTVKEGTTEHTEILKLYNNALSALDKERLENVKNYIADKKSLDQLSLKDEVIIWEQNLAAFVEGSKERLEAQKNYKSALDALNKEIVSINENYQSQMQKINDELIKNEEEVTKKFNDTFTSRQNALFSFASTFDEFKIEVETTGEQLLANLQGQVDGFKLWQEQFEQISQRGINDELLKELSELGPKALPQLMALNSLTDEQLTQYSDTYAEKSRLAREQAEKELIGMKDDTEKQIIALREVADQQLSALQVEWELKIKSVTQATSNELSSLKQIGVNAGQGLLNGLSSMTGPLIDKATQIANAIKEAMQSALDIHSPSRVMKGFGINIAEGLIQGMNSMIAEVEKSSTGLAGAVVGGQKSYDYSKSFAPVVHINTVDSGANEMQRTLRRMAYGIL